MSRRFPAFTVVALLALLPSCKAVQSFIHDGEVVARLGNHKLYLSELEKVVPNGISPEDSAALANSYINSWAVGKAFQDIAEQKLSKEEKDVSKELEDYRQSLLRYRFEQRFISERLDTSVSAREVGEYYDAHKDNFKLERPIVKARFMKISEDSPNLQKIKKLMSSDNVDDVVAADSLAFNSAQRYVDCSDTWVDAATLAGDFGVDYVAMLSRKNGRFIEIKDGDGFLLVAFVADMVKAGEIPPVEFCEERITDIIISGRKHKLLTTLERDLIEDAKAKENFEIYSTK
ncbi:MAG: hypothetical protein IJ840_03340 [Bacteroidales bacterium]|nr:hypothetical protein [Bacteroidales bacterium]